MQGTATLGELSGPSATYSLTDIYKANALLDMQSDIDAARQPQEQRPR